MPGNRLLNASGVPTVTENYTYACDFSFSDFLDVNSYEPSLAFQPYAPDMISQNVTNEFQFTYL